MLLAGTEAFGKGGSFRKGGGLCTSFRISHGAFCPGTPVTQTSPSFWGGCLQVFATRLPRSPAGKARAGAAPPKASAEVSAALGDRDGVLQGQAGDWVWPAIPRHC